MQSLPLNPFLTVTPHLFAEKGFPPVLSSPKGPYHGFHIERYVHDLPAIDTPPQRDNLLVMPLKPLDCAFQQGRRGLRKRAQPGDVYIIPQGHFGRWEWQNQVDVLHLRMECEWFQRIVPQSGVQQVEFVEQYGFSDPQIHHIGLALLAEVEAGCPGGRLFGEGMATALTAHLLANHAAFPRIAEKAHGSLSEVDTKRVTDYLQDNLAADVSLSTLAGIVAISPHYFCRLFKQSVGLSPHQFVIKIRVERAKNLLLQKPRLYTVAQVAHEVGFSDASHLIRHMKRRLGVTPGEVSSR